LFLEELTVSIWHSDSRGAEKYFPKQFATIFIDNPATVIDQQLKKLIMNYLRLLLQSFS
jgi:hypothetical protein